MEFTSDTLGVANGVLKSTDFDPPEVRRLHAIHAKGQIFGPLEAIGEVRRDKRLRFVGAPHLNQQRVAHCLRIADFGLNVFAKLVARFAPNAGLGAAKRRQNRVARTVDKKSRRHAVPGLRRALPGAHAFNFAFLHHRAGARAIEKQRQVRLCRGGAPQHAVPHRIVERRVAMQVFELNFFEQTSFFVAFAVSATNPHPHFARSVAAQNGPVVQQCGAGAAARRGDGRAKSGHAAADDANVEFVSFEI